ncbi:hypothetical protein GCM10023107_31840 [Actinoplanes octamycinicus]|nr:hypothetical protein Aoc01nite_43570 [Actinoplanes octamycinicus]
MRQHPLEESLILWIIAQLMIKIEPQRGRDEERNSQETYYCENVLPGERAPHRTAPDRLRGLLFGLFPGGCGGDRRRRGDAVLKGAQLGVQVLGSGHLARRQNGLTGRLARRVKTRNRHSIGEPNRGWEEFHDERPQRDRDDMYACFPRVRGSLARQAVGGG